jgi:hypothetical protein
MLLYLSYQKNDYHLWIEAFLPHEAKICIRIEGQTIGTRREIIFGKQTVDSAVAVSSDTTLDFPTGGGPEF